MKKSWIVAGLGIVVVVAVGVFMLTTKNTNDTKNAEKQTTESTEFTEKVIIQGKVNPSVNSVPSSAAGGEKEWLAGYAEENLSAPVLALLGLDGKLHDYNSMLSAIGMLPKGNIAADDVAALRDMLTWPNDQFPEGMRDIEINAVKNDVLDRLLRQKKLPEAMGYQLVDMFADTESDPVWKDYCVQFMSGFYEKQSEVLGVKFQEGQSEESAQSVDELDAVREAMFTALEVRNETIAGTALIGLELLSRSHGEFDRDMILDKASEIAANEAVSNESRLTALRMSALTGGDETTADTARLLAQTGETMLMRSAALVTLGETGGPEDRELIESFTFDDDRQVAAAKLALEKMDARGL
jgi:hypothetical protein